MKKILFLWLCFPTWLLGQSFVTGLQDVHNQFENGLPHGNKSCVTQPTRNLISPFGNIMQNTTPFLLSGGKILEDNLLRHQRPGFQKSEARRKKSLGLVYLSNHKELEKDRKL